MSENMSYVKILVITRASMNYLSNKKKIFLKPSTPFQGNGQTSCVNLAEKKSLIIIFTNW